MSTVPRLRPSRDEVLHCAPCYAGYPGECQQSCTPGCDGVVPCVPAARSLTGREALREMECRYPSP